MKKALVLGASGGMGYSIVKELSNRGIKVIAFARSKEKLSELFKEDQNVIIHPGNAFHQDELEKAVQGVDVLFHAINIPYSDWAEKLPKLTQNIIATAKKYSIKLMVVDNIYAYGITGANTKEDTPKDPNTKKGKVRLEMERLIKNSGVTYVIAHFPDFYGPHAENAQLNYMLKQVAMNKKASFIGNKSIAREHIYTPDGAKAMVELAIHKDAINQNWNIPAYDVISGDEVIQIIRDLTGYDKPISTVTKNMIRFVGLINKQLREFVEMQYLNEKPVILNGTNYEKVIGPVPRTPYQEGMKETIRVYSE